MLIAFICATVFSSITVIIGLSVGGPSSFTNACFKAHFYGPGLSAVLVPTALIGVSGLIAFAGAAYKKHQHLNLKLDTDDVTKVLENTHKEMENDLEKKEKITKKSKDEEENLKNLINAIKI